jgi:hypothetical protein
MWKCRAQADGGKRKKRKVQAAPSEQKDVQPSLASSSPAKPPDSQPPAHDTVMVDAPGASTPPQTTEAAPGGSSGVQRGTIPPPASDSEGGLAPVAVGIAPNADGGELRDGDASAVEAVVAGDGTGPAGDGGGNAVQLLPAQAAFMELVLAECDNMALSAGQQVRSKPVCDTVSLTPPNVQACAHMFVGVHLLFPVPAVYVLVQEIFMRIHFAMNTVMGS